MVDTSNGDGPPPELPPPTIPENLQFSYSGFASEQEAYQLHAIVQPCLTTISTVLNLERLDGVTIAYDYAAALANLDRGFEASVPLRPSTELVQGIAMAPAVMRDGVLKARLVLDASYLNVLEGEDPERARFIVYTLAHECAHVHDLRARDMAIPGVYLRQQLPNYEAALRFQTSSACWDEYAACRLSATFNPDHIRYYQQVFLEVLDGARDRANQRIRDYLDHRDQHRVVTEVAAEYRSLMTYASYMLGHLAGLDQDLPEEVEAKLEDHWFTPFLVQLDAALGELWGRYGEWTDLAEFDSLGQLGRLVMISGGVDFRRVGDQFYLRVDESRGA